MTLSFFIQVLTMCDLFDDLGGARPIEGPVQQR
jgi:hypothetical protein